MGYSIKPQAIGSVTLYDVFSAWQNECRLWFMPFEVSVATAYPHTHLDVLIAYADPELIPKVRQSVQRIMDFNHERRRKYEKPDWCTPD